MDALEELNSLLSGGSRVLVISSRDVDLRPESGDNALVLLKLAEGSLAAGGRGGGFGERRVVMVAGYQRVSGTWSKVFETGDEDQTSKFEIPYYVSRIPFSLKDGTDSMGYGVVEEELALRMLSEGKALSSP